MTCNEACFKRRASHVPNALETIDNEAFQLIFYCFKCVRHMKALRLKQAWVSGNGWRRKQIEIIMDGNFVMPSIMSKLGLIIVWKFKARPSPRKTIKHNFSIWKRTAVFVRQYFWLILFDRISKSTSISRFSLVLILISCMVLKFCA
jgi:hypothetical protein